MIILTHYDRLRLIVNQPSSFGRNVFLANRRRQKARAQALRRFVIAIADTADVTSVAIYKDDHEHE